MSRTDTVLLIILLLMVFVFLAPAEGFFIMFLRRLSAAGFAAIAALAVLLLFKHLKR